MSKIIIVIGLPGSGKTHYIKNKFSSNKSILICEDYYKNSGGIFADSEYYYDVINALKENREIIISDIIFCQKGRLAKFINILEGLSKSLGVKIDLDFIYFENNPECCKKNVIKRNREERTDIEMSFIEKVSPKYKIPKGEKMVPVFDK